MMFKKQHYVPMFYLKGFSSGKSISGNFEIFVLEKGNQKTSKTIINNAACKSYMYSAHNAEGEYDLSLERYFSRLENKASSALRNILNNTTQPNIIISNEERLAVSAFIRAFLFRNPNTLASVTKGIDDFMKEKGMGIRDGIDESNIKKSFALEAISRFDKDNIFLELLYNKTWRVIDISRTRSTFIISDFPLCITYQGPLYSDETQILFPIDSTHAIVMRGNNGGISFDVPSDSIKARTWIRNVNLDMLKCASEEAYGSESKWLEHLMKISNTKIFQGHPFFENR